MSSSALPRHILEVVVYFDLFSYPLTTLEIWKNLRVRASYREVDQSLHASAWLQERVEGKAGLWYLKGRQETVGERCRRYRASKYKIDQARRFARFARWIPGLSAIYVCNSLGFLDSRPESDIDFFVTVKRGRIWTVRFFCVALAKLFFRRPEKSQVQDALCLSFFTTEGAQLRKVALPGGDVYLEYWLKNLLLLWKSGNPPKLHLRWSFSRVNTLEKLLRLVQLKIMPAQLRALANKGTSVVMTDEFLKFHDHDQRDYYRRQWKARLAALGV